MNDKKGIVLIALLSLVILFILIFDQEVSQSISVLTGMVPVPPGGGGLNDCPCLDGTAVEQCSINQPFYCNQYEEIGDGAIRLACELVEDCGACGCPDDNRCSRNGMCSTLNITPPFDNSTEDDEDDDSGTCISDGTVYGLCSLTIPLYCDDGELISDCSYCGCAVGYYCSEENICLIDMDISNETSGGDTTTGDVLWEDIDNKYEVDDRVSPLEILEISEQRVRYSPADVASERLELNKVVEKLKIHEKTILDTDKKVKDIEDTLKLSDPEELENIFEDEQVDILGGDTYQGIFEDLDEEPAFSPQGGPTDSALDIPELACVSRVNGYCNVAGVQCCDGLICSGGVCLSSDNVSFAEIEGEIEVSEEDPLEEDNYGNKLVLHDEHGFANLVEIDVLEGGSESDIKVYKYTTYPNFVPSPDIEDAVSFGVYDISLNEEAKAELSFDVLNDLLVLNQVESLAVYRYTDGHWETLDLLDAFIYSDMTRLKVETTGFSFFSIVGQKEDLTSLESIGVSSEETSLWSVYRRSYSPGVSVLEVFFGDQNKLVFGNVFDEPFIDLVING
jgi:hypothetical protein